MHLFVRKPITYGLETKNGGTLQKLQVTGEVTNFSKKDVKIIVVS